MLVQGRCWAVIGSTHRWASLVDSAYDVSLSGRAAVGCQRCRQRAPRPATALVWAEVFVEPEPRVFRVEGSRSLRVLSEYLGIDPHRRAADRRQLPLAPTSTPRKPAPGCPGLRTCFPAPGRRPVCAHRRAGARSRLEGVSHEQAFAGNGWHYYMPKPPSEV
jgi:hypothetical protein